ncbi:flagellar basal body P-ring formation chaperone FlgA [Vibrio barjaei]|uniref:flagellar basal body P-ring formation chaperone FlgA n=1 Tax=Vibrio barjaei TaxID=1676683 RepID=UPI002283A2D5|nr:flagellar basal body P-ring formation chaperone FlgA [Vibrio barjaei]MCY9872302.1 flagellar basal body P-ring formation chaperone FlgA [Vibrio barjaei]
MSLTSRLRCNIVLFSVLIGSLPVSASSDFHQVFRDHVEAMPSSQEMLQNSKVVIQSLKAPRKWGFVVCRSPKFESNAGDFLGKKKWVVKCGDERMIFYADIRLKASLPKLVKAVPKGGVIESSDIDWSDVSLKSSSGLMLTNPIGMIAKKNLREGLIKTGRVGSPGYVFRGQSVTVVLGNGAVTVSTKARLLEDGDVGEQIRVRLESTGVMKTTLYDGVAFRVID